MNRSPLLFLGIFGALAFSFTGMVLVNQVGYGALTPFKDDTEGKAYPLQVPGLAARGKLVYQDLGCATCHTQQVRRDGYGTDVARKWGDQPGGSVARDYIREGRVLLGSVRIGPDLRNVGVRLTDANALFLHLYDPALVVPGSTMPPSRFLFEQRKILGEPSPKALKLPAGVAPGSEIVPTARAENLVAYLLSLKDTYSSYPESNYIYAPPAPEKGAEGKPAASPAPVKPAAAPSPATPAAPAKEAAK